jgi:hypothetical protein
LEEDVASVRREKTGPRFEAARPSSFTLGKVLRVIGSKAVLMTRLAKPDKEQGRMSDGRRSFTKNAFRESSEPARGAVEAHVGQGTVFVRPAEFVEPPYSMRLATEFHGTWLVITNAVAGGVEQEFMDSGRSLSAGVAMEASAFGCDSKVLDRAVRRLLETAAARSFDSVEITELRRHQDSGLDYVTILAVGRTVLREPPSEPVDRRVSSAVWQLEG